MSQHAWTTRDEPGSGGTAEYQDTVALLQEELTKLEQENRLLREARDAQVQAQPELELAGIERAYRERIDGLNADLQGREETIGFLLDQIALAEEAEAAMRAEYTQLHQWLAQLEERVEKNVEGVPARQDDEVERLRREATAAKREADSQRQAFEAERRAAAARQARADEEVERLRNRLTDLAQSAEESHESASVIAVLEEENRRLRQSCLELGQSLVAAGDADALREELEQAHSQLVAAREQLDEMGRMLHLERDERSRERNALETSLASTRAQAARENQQAAQAPPPASPAGRDTSIDERIRAFRQHLQEVHNQEEKERQKKSSFAGRLSKVWIKSRPK